MYVYIIYIYVYIYVPNMSILCMPNLRPEASRQSPDQLRRPATQYAWPGAVPAGSRVVQNEGINVRWDMTWYDGFVTVSTWYILIFDDLWIWGLQWATPCQKHTIAYFGKANAEHEPWDSRLLFQTNSCFQWSKLSNATAEHWKSGQPSQNQVGRSSEACIIMSSPFVICQWIIWHIPPQRLPANGTSKLWEVGQRSSIFLPHFWMRYK